MAFYCAFKNLLREVILHEVFLLLLSQKVSHEGRKLLEMEILFFFLLVFCLGCDLITGICKYHNSSHCYINYKEIFVHQI